MAHYAFLDENNIVVEVIVGKDEGEDGIDWEQHYGEFRGKVCKRTSYNTRDGVYYDPITKQPATDQSKAFRKQFAGVGYIYDKARDAFYLPQPYPSWVLNEQMGIWEAPIPQPADDNYYKWDEANQQWVINDT